jgi:hypothetical protein
MLSAYNRSISNRENHNGLPLLGGDAYGSESGRYLLEILGRDAGPAANNRVSLLARPFVPAPERLGNTASKRGSDRPGLSACENGLVDRDRPPPGQPARQGRHARQIS